MDGDEFRLSVQKLMPTDGPYAGKWTKIGKPIDNYIVKKVPKKFLWWSWIGDTFEDISYAEQRKKAAEKAELVMKEANGNRVAIMEYRVYIDDDGMPLYRFRRCIWMDGNWC